MSFLNFKKKKILWFDMDGVLVDFGWGVRNSPFMQKEPDRWDGRVDEIPGIYRDLPPVKGAVEAVKQIHESGKFDMNVATTNSWGNPYGATDKRFCIEKHFGDIFYKKLTITHGKDLLKGHYLIDDRLKNGAAAFGGEHIHFGTTLFPDWNSVLNYLL